MNVTDLKKLFTLLKGGKTIISTRALSAFSIIIKEALLSHGYRNTSDLKFHGNSDPAEFLWRFRIEMDDYQLLDLVRCWLLSATFKDNVQHMFQKLEANRITSMK